MKKDSKIQARILDEYKYFYDFNSYNIERLFHLFSSEGRDGFVKLMRRFSGTYGTKNLMKFCDENRIKHRFFSIYRITITEHLKY